MSESVIAGRLARLVAGHRRRFSWYDTLLAAGGTASSAPLEALPRIDEALLTAHYYRAEQAPDPGEQLFLTSGTSGGARKRISYSAADHEAYVAQRKAIFAEFLADVPAASIAAADLGTGHAAASAVRIFRELGYDARSIDFSLPLEQHVALLNEWQPAVLFTMPMILDQLLRVATTAIAPRKVIVVGDIAPESWRRRVARELGIRFEDVLDVYGSIEVGAIAYYVAAAGEYHFHDHILPEAIAVAGGAQSPRELLLTSFSRSHFPAVRFATQDEIRGLRRSSWRGHPVWALDCIAGRLDGDFKCGERISQYDLCRAVNEAFPGALFDVLRTQPLTVRIVAAEIDPQRERVFHDSLMALCPDVALMVRSRLAQCIRLAAIPPSQLQASRGKRRLAATG